MVLPSCGSGPANRDSPGGDTPAVRWRGTPVVRRATRGHPSRTRPRWDPEVTARLERAARPAPANHDSPGPPATLDGGEELDGDGLRAAAEVAGDAGDLLRVRLARVAGERGAGAPA